MHKDRFPQLAYLTNTPIINQQLGEYCIPTTGIFDKYGKTCPLTVQVSKLPIPTDSVI